MASLRAVDNTARKRARRVKAVDALVTPRLSLPANLLDVCAVAALLLTLFQTLGPQSSAIPSATLYLWANSFLFVATILNCNRGGVSLVLDFFFLFFVAIPARVQIGEGKYPFLSTYSVEQLHAGFQVLVVAQLALLTGRVAYFLRATSTERVQRPTDREIDFRFYFRVMILMAVVAAPIAVYLGQTVLLSTRAELADLAAEDTGIQGQLLHVGRSLSLFAAVIAIFYWRAHRKGRRDGRPLLAAYLFVAAVFVAFNYPPSMPRFELLGTTIAIAAISANFFSLRMKLGFALAAPPFLFFLFPTIKSLGATGSVDFSAVLSRDVGEYLQSVDFDGFKQVVDTCIYLQQGNEMRGGASFLGSALFWVPRSLWEGKPRQSGELVSTALGYEYNNVSSPLPAEAFLAGGYVTVVLVFGLFGWLLTRLEERSRQVGSVATFRQEFLFYALLMGFLTIILRGALTSVAPMFGTAFLAYLGAAWLHQRRVKRTSSVSGPVLASTVR